MRAEITQTRLAYSGRAKIIESQVRLKSGATTQREIVEQARIAAVLPYDLDRRMVMLVRLVRAPVLLGHGPQLMMEAPAGLIVEGESSEQTIHREALEETGLRLGALEKVASVWTSPGFSTEQMDLYLANYALPDRIAKGGGLESEREEIEPCEIEAGKIWDEVSAGAVRDLKTLALLLALRIREPGFFSAANKSRG